MNAQNAKDYLPLVQAIADGKQIQYKYKRADGSDDWLTLMDGIVFDCSPDHYRIKPEPKEIWMNRYETGDEIGPYYSCDVARTCANPGATQVRYREVVE